MEKTKKKKTIVIGCVAILIVLLAGLGIVVAGGPCGFERGWHPGFNGKTFHAGFGDRDISDFMLWRLDRGVEELDLTEEQQTRYSELKNEIDAAFAKGKEMKAVIRDEIHSEFEKENPDLEFIAENAKSHMNELKLFMHENIDLFKEFYGMLNEEQKAKVIDKIKERMESHMNS